jgi:FtsH-binding integral membrane protein
MNDNANAMNRAEFAEFWYRKHNKVLAILFASLALACFFGYYLTMECIYSWRYFQNDLTHFWNFFVYLIVYLIILIGNIRNDNIAYTGILMFIFYMAYDNAVTIIKSGNEVVKNLSSSGSFDPLFLLYGLSWAGIVGIVFVGIFLYVRSAQYMRGSFTNFKVIRLLSILFASCIILVFAFPLFMFLASGYFAALFILLINIADAFIGLSVIFTMERLRRV